MKLKMEENRKKTQKNAERQKTGFPKEQVENADSSKPALKKIMNTDE